MRLCRTCEAEGARVRQVFTADELAFLCGAAVDQMRKVAQMTPEHKASLPPGMLKGATTTVYKLLLGTPPELRRNVIEAFKRLANTDLVLDQCEDDPEAVVH